MEPNVSFTLEKHTVNDAFLSASKMMKKNNWFIEKMKQNRFFEKNENVWVIGSFLYKENPNDLDIVSSDSIFFCSKFIAFVQGTFYYKKSNTFAEKYGNRNMFMEFARILFKNERGPNVDVIGLQEHIQIINGNGLSMINALMLDLNTVKDDENILDQAKHVFEVKEIAPHLDLKAKDAKAAEAERRWVIEQINKKSYCKWWGMREKDKQALKNWKVLDESLCEKHGMFNTKYKN